MVAPRLKGLILAAGFGTRLSKGLDSYTGPHKEELEKFVRDKPKGLVQINGFPVASYLLRQLQRAGIEMCDIYVHSNELYYDQFKDWALGVGLPEKNVLSNGVMELKDALGAVPDFKHALDSKVGYDSPLIVMYSDTLIFNGEVYAELREHVEGFNKDGLPRMTVYECPGDPTSYGVVKVDERGLVLDFEEKPKRPKSNLVNAGVYLYTPEQLQDIRDHWEVFMNLKNLQELLHCRHPTVAVEVERRADIGTIEDVIRLNGLKEEKLGA